MQGCQLLAQLGRPVGGQRGGSCPLLAFFGLLPEKAGQGLYGLALFPAQVAGGDVELFGGGVLGQFPAVAQVQNLVEPVVAGVGGGGGRRLEPLDGLAQGFGPFPGGGVDPQHPEEFRAGTEGGIVEVVQGVL